MTTPVPLVQPIDYEPVPDLLARLSHIDKLVVFDSVRFDAVLGRYSFIALDPFERVVVKDQRDPFALLQQKLHHYPLATLADLPPFQGGLAGFLSYDLARSFEQLPAKAEQDIEYPDLMLGLFDLVLSLDHHRQKAWLFSSGYPEQKEALRKQRAVDRISWCHEQLAQFKSMTTSRQFSAQKIAVNFQKADYEQAVERAVEYILEGDIFEVNLSQRFSVELDESITAFALYQRLCCYNPAPFASLIQLGDTQIISSSPERFLQLRNNKVETRPIKGTIRRDADLQQDAVLQQQLLESEKDRAENTMIVDLMRNDLSKVCVPGTVKVTQLCKLESFANLHHLVSAVEGELSANKGALDLLRATFPGGSITGAPKIRAMEIIDELEPTRRGPYCGCAGYIGFNGAMDTSILIRSYVMQGNRVTFQAGGAVILDSDPAHEYAETLVKAATLKNVLDGL